MIRAEQQLITRGTPWSFLHLHLPSPTSTTPPVVNVFKSVPFAISPISLIPVNGMAVSVPPREPTTPGFGNTTELQETEFSISRVKLQNLPHLSSYLPDSQLPVRISPLHDNPFFHPSQSFYIGPTDVVLRHIAHDLSGTFPLPSPCLAYLRAGPHHQVYFEPSEVRAAIVTCGGLCPGMNTVIRELVVGLWELYGVREIYGVKAGYRGFYSMEPLRLDPKMVDSFHKRGGTMLETSRGGFDLHKIVDAIHQQGFNQVPVCCFCL